MSGIMAEPRFLLNGASFTKAELLSRALVFDEGRGLDRNEEAFYRFLEEWFNEEDEIEIATSGSTGTPKRYRIQKEKMVASAKATQTIFNYQAGENLLLCLSTEYIAGKMMVVRALTSGCNLITVPVTSNPLKTLEPQTRISFAAMVPLQIQTIMELSQDLSATVAHLSNIDRLLLGGSQLTHHQEQFLAGLPCRCYEGYGMTETLSHIAVRRITTDPASRYFAPLPGVSVSLDSRGCLRLSVAHLQITNLVTNDLAEITKAGSFAILGRIDNVINTGSIKVFPEQVEQKLQRIFPGVRFIVFPIPDEKFQNMVAVLIEGKSRQPSLEDIRKQSSGILQPYETPKKARYTEKFVCTSSGKIIRHKTIQLLGNEG